jgi:hypothetical protein
MVAQLVGRYGICALAQANAEVIPGEPAPTVRLITEVSLETEGIYVEVGGSAKISNRQNVPRTFESSHSRAPGHTNSLAIASGQSKEIAIQHHVWSAFVFLI